MVIENVNVIVPNDNSRPAGLYFSLVSKEAIAGAIGGCATRFLSQPFDVLKIRFQVLAILLVNLPYLLCYML